MRRNEVPTPSQINDHFVFKTSPSPTELSLHLPTQLFETGLSSGQSMRELNPIHLLDRKVCKTITLPNYPIFTDQIVQSLKIMKQKKIPPSKVPPERIELPLKA